MAIITGGAALYPFGRPYEGSADNPPTPLSQPTVPPSEFLRGRELGIHVDECWFAGLRSGLMVCNCSFLL